MTGHRWRDAAPEAKSGAARHRSAADPDARIKQLADKRDIDCCLRIDSNTGQVSLSDERCGY
jgi:hypothetical protein